MNVNKLFFLCLLFMGISIRASAEETPQAISGCPTGGDYTDPECKFNNSNIKSCNTKTGGRGAFARCLKVSDTDDLLVEGSDGLKKKYNVAGACFRAKNKNGRVNVFRMRGADKFVNWELKTDGYSRCKAIELEDSTKVEGCYIFVNKKGCPYLNKVFQDGKQITCQVKKNKNKEARIHVTYFQNGHSPYSEDEENNDKFGIQDHFYDDSPNDLKEIKTYCTTKAKNIFWQDKIDTELSILNTLNPRKNVHFKDKDKDKDILEDQCKGTTPPPKGTPSVDGESEPVIIDPYLDNWGALCTLQKVQVTYDYDAGTKNWERVDLKNKKKKDIPDPIKTVVPPHIDRGEPKNYKGINIYWIGSSTSKSEDPVPSS